MTFEKFIDTYGVTMTSQKIAAPLSPFRSTQEDEKWQREADHYIVTLSYLGKSASFSYSMGSAHKEGPKLPEVLWSLHLDSTSVDESFEHWAAEFGYDSDSRRAERIYLACQDNRAKLRDLFSGGNVFQEFMACTEEEEE